MAKPPGTVELRIFVAPEKRNEIKSIAAASGKTITEYFVDLHEQNKRNKFDSKAA